MGTIHFWVALPWVLLLLGGMIVSYNIYQAFVAYLIHRIRRIPKSAYRGGSGIPLVGGGLLLAAALSGGRALVAPCVILLVLDPLGPIWAMVILSRDREFWHFRDADEGEED